MKVKSKVFKGTVILILVAIWLLFRNFPHITEKFYSLFLYPIIAQIFHFLFGWLPFSVGDIFYTVLIGFVIFYLVKNRKKIRQQPIIFLGKATFFGVQLIFVFFLLWGFNYFRLPLEKSLKVAQEHSKVALFRSTQKLVNKANVLHLQLTLNADEKVVYKQSLQDIYQEAFRCFSTDFIIPLAFEYRYKSVKNSLYSPLLTYMGYSGYLNPFTNEAQVNALMVGYSLPVTACHEIAHQMGYAAENEANFIGYVMAKQSQDLYFQYSATLFALKYLLAEVRKNDTQKYNEFIGQLRQGIFENYKEVRQFWQQYQNLAEPLFKASYDAFLKANNQQEGIRSYDFVTKLIIWQLEQE